MLAAGGSQPPQWLSTHPSHETRIKDLQDYAQRSRATIPAYKVMKEEGPDHKKMFHVVVELAGSQYGPAFGANKKEAEQRAAKKALQALGPPGVLLVDRCHPVL